MPKKQSWNPGGGDSIAEHREDFRAEYSEVARRLGAELDELVKLCALARESLTNEMTSGMAYRKEALSDKDLRKLKELAQTMDIAVGAKVRFEKSAKALADSMTPEQEFSSVMQYIYSLDINQIHDIIWRCKQHLDYRHNRIAKQVDNPDQ